MKNAKLRMYVSAVAIVAFSGFFQGSLMAEQKNPTVQINPDGSKFIDDGDGTTVKIEADGTKTVNTPDGTSVQMKPDGSKFVKQADGTTVQVNPPK